MSNLNTNRTLNELVELVEADLNKRLKYMPDDFNNQQREALEMFKQRIFLEEVIEETISFNRLINWEDINSNLKLVSNAEELIEVFKLRSDIFHEVGYQNAFPDKIEGLNFDKYDMKSAIIYCTNNNEATGTLRLIFDSNNKLPSDSIMSFDYLRKEYNNIAELSRNIIKQQTNKLGLEFKYLMGGVHNLFSNNDIDMTISGIKTDHYKLCSKFGGMEILKEVESYGDLNQSSLIIAWDLSKISKFFKKAILNQR